MLKGDVHVRYAEAFMSHLKSFIDASLKTVSSENIYAGSFVTRSYTSSLVYEL
jgi:CLIP-associating protein 1/2